MKKNIYICLMAILLSFIGSSVTTSCSTRENKDPYAEHFSKHELRQDSAWFNAMYKFCVTDKNVDSFDNVADIVYYQDQLQSEYGCREVFMSMPPQAVADVSHVLFRAHKRITIVDIVEEYTSHQRIYDGLIQEIEDDEVPDDVRYEYDDIRSQDSIIMMSALKSNPKTNR